MNIKTKFDPGQTVYIVEYASKKKVCRVCNKHGLVTIKGREFICPACNGNKRVVSRPERYSVTKCVVQTAYARASNTGSVKPSLRETYFLTRSDGTVLTEVDVDFIYSTEVAARAEARKLNREGARK